MNFKFDKDTVIIVLIGCLLMGGWLLYMPKYQAKKAAEELAQRQNTQQSGMTQQNASAAAATQNAASAQNSATTEAESGSENIQALKETKTALLENGLFHVTIDGLTGSVFNVKLTDPRYKLKDSQEAIELFREGAHRTFELKSVPALSPVALDVKENGPRSAEVVRTFSNGLVLTQTFALPEEDDYIVTCKYVWSNPTPAVVKLDDLGIRLAGLPQVKNLTGDKVYSERLNVDYCKDGGSCNSVSPEAKDDKFARKTTCGEPVAWVGSSNKFFASLLFADEARPFATSNGDRIWRLPAGSSNEKDQNT